MNLITSLLRFSAFHLTSDHDWKRFADILIAFPSYTLISFELCQGEKNMFSNSVGVEVSL